MSLILTFLIRLLIILDILSTILAAAIILTVIAYNNEECHVKQSSGIYSTATYLKTNDAQG